MVVVNTPYLTRTDPLSYGSDKKRHIFIGPLRVLVSFSSLSLFFLLPWQVMLEAILILRFFASFFKVERQLVSFQ